MVDKPFIFLSKYNGWNTYIETKCKVCNNIWKPTPSNLLQGTGCPYCNNINNAGSYGRMSEKDVNILGHSLYLYIVKLQYKDEIFYKYGLTKNIDKTRYNQYKPYKVVEEISFEELNAWTAICKERDMESNYIPKHKFSGHTECFTKQKLN